MSYKMSRKNWIVAETTRTFEHRGEAWRVLAMQRYELFPNLPSLLLKKTLFQTFY